MTEQKQISEGAVVEGFIVERVRHLPGLNADGVYLTHKRLGTRLLHVHNSDVENLIAITIPTPPADDTGLPHIMEHSVLAGSKRFPLKDPFFEILKCSLATFINAMTFDTFTMYPFSSAVRKDLFNLAELYFDAVYHPLISRQTFAREAYHLTPTGKADEPLAINGIVYNEMKAAYSSPDSFLWQNVMRMLYPDIPLRFESGGDPAAIPDLTYETFRRFHETLYHPSRSYVFCCGNIPTADFCRFFDAGFAPFSKADNGFSLQQQPRWSSPKKHRAHYPVGANESVSGKTYHQLAWAAGGLAARGEFLPLATLMQVLTGTDAAPLKKAVIDSKLGADVNNNMVHAMAPEIICSTGIKGSEPEHADAYTSLVLDTLADVRRDGIKPDAIRTAIRQLSYRYCERTSRSLVDLAAQLMPNWLTTDDPFSFVDLPALIKNEEAHLASGDVLMSLLEERILKNNHMLALTLSPDAGMKIRMDEAHTNAMKARAAKLSADDMRKLREQTEELDSQNAAADTPEVLATLPRLTIGDIPQRPYEISTAAEIINGRVTLLCNDMQSNGIAYCIIDADLSGLPAELYPLLPVFKDIFDRMGTEQVSYVDMAKRRAAAARYITSSFYFSPDAKKPGKVTPHLKCWFVTTEDSFDDALAVMAELMSGISAADEARLSDVARRYHASFRDRLMNDPLEIAQLHARRNLSAYARMDYEMRGVPGYRLSQRFADEFLSAKDDVIRSVAAIRDHARASGRITASCTGSSAVMKKARSFLQSYYADDASCTAEALREHAYAPVFDGIALSLQTSHSVFAMPAIHATHRDTHVLKLATALATNDYWLPEVRLKGGAYSAFISYDHRLGTWSAWSYADPDFLKTQTAFRGMLRYITSVSIDADHLEQTIIGRLKHHINPLMPDQATHAALERHLIHETPSDRAAAYDAIRSATGDDVKRVLREHLEANADTASMSVAGSPADLTRISAALDKPLAIDDVFGNAE
ncbi:MAG: insulinase family protein [Spirochaetes bacterium]|nr:insulinase family protein [Spirochaetota bacterium]